MSDPILDEVFATAIAEGKEQAHRRDLAAVWCVVLGLSVLVFTGTVSPFAWKVP
jgi:hypothetical protein